MKYFFYLIFIFNLVLCSVSCKKANITEDETPENELINGRRIKYTVLVVSAANTIKNTAGLDSAEVTLAMNGKIVTHKTENGLATFDNLAAGTATVTVSLHEHTTANYIVDLKQSDTLYDSENARNASSMVMLFSLTDNGTATIAGKVFANLDLSQTNYQEVTSPISVIASIETNQFADFINHDGDGEITHINYENSVFIDTVKNGNYQLIVPASGRGLKIVLQGDEFSQMQTQADASSIRKIFKNNIDTLTVVSGKTYIFDVFYNSN